MGNYSLSEIKELAAIALKSQLYPDLQSQEAAIVKMMIAQELGIPIFEALRSIDIVKGNISLRSHLIAGMIKRSGKYQYSILERSPEICRIEYFELLDGKWLSLGISIFSMDEARKANLAGRETWKAYPQDMLYNRAQSRGARLFCPDIFYGGVYDADSQEIPVDEIPMPRLDIASPAQPLEQASEKQIAAIAARLRSRGIADPHHLISFMGIEAMPLEQADKHLQSFTGKNIPDTFFGAHIRMLREERDISREAIETYLLESFGVDKPFGLSKEQQMKLLAWLSTEDESDEAPEAGIPGFARGALGRFADIPFLKPDDSDEEAPLLPLEPAVDAGPYEGDC